MLLQIARHQGSVGELAQLDGSPAEHQGWRDGDGAMGGGQAQLVLVRSLLWFLSLEQKGCSKHATVHSPGRFIAELQESLVSYADGQACPQNRDAQGDHIKQKTECHHL